MYLFAKSDPKRAPLSCPLSDDFSCILWAIFRRFFKDW